MSEHLDKITISGFKSIKNLENFKLNNLNILIGPNGAGKSNFIEFFELLNNIVKERLQHFVNKKGGADQFLYLGPKVTKTFNGKLYFKVNGYGFTLEPTDTNSLIFEKETMYFAGVFWHSPQWYSIGMGNVESNLKNEYNNGKRQDIASYIYPTISSWTVYHFQDTSDSASVKRQTYINDNEKLNHDAGNLAAFLFTMQIQNPVHYNKILKTVQMVAPFIDQFKLRPIPYKEDKIQFEWLQRGSDFPFTARHLSDGTLRFICLATALLQPNPPATIILDEPELGLHPYALARLADILKLKSNSTQVIVSTQSTYLIDHFQPEDIIVVDRNSEGASEFKRCNEQELKDWLEDYSMGELWEKNVIGGRP